MPYLVSVGIGTERGLLVSRRSLGAISDDEAKALLAQTIEETRREFPDFKIVPKSESALMKALDIGLKIVTFGQMKSFLSYHTTIGTTMYAGPTWDMVNDVQRIILIRHEREHMRERAEMGGVLYTVMYLVPFFPVGLAYGRARLEWRAYEAGLLAKAELKGKEAVLDPDYRAMIVRQFTGPSYGWMWPFPSQVNAWYDEALKKAGALGASEAGTVPAWAGAAAVGAVVGFGALALLCEARG